MIKMRKGDNYIQEKTGSATKINQSGQSEYEYDENGFPSGLNPESAGKAVTKLRK